MTIFIILDVNLHSFKANFAISDLQGQGNGKSQIIQICSKTLNENNTYRINNYTRIKKDELVSQMNTIYDLLVFD